MKSARMQNIACLGQVTTPKSIRHMLKAFCLAMMAIGLSASIASADTFTIAVTNGSFETHGALNNATYWWSLGSPWVGGISPQGYEVLQVNQFNTFTAAADGLYAVNLESWLVSVTQDLLTTVNAGDTLSMTFSGGRAKAGLPGVQSNGGKFTATFKVGTTEYTSSQFDTGLQANDSWSNYVFTANIANAGNLSIIFKPVSDRPWLDKVSNVTVIRGPPTPTGLTAARGSAGGSILLNWIASSGATGYKLYRSETNSFTTNMFVGSTSGLNATNRTDIVPHFMTNYYYAVTATNSDGESDWSLPSNVINLPQPGMVITIH